MPTRREESFFMMFMSIVVAMIVYIYGDPKYLSVCSGAVLWTIFVCWCEVYPGSNKCKCYLDGCGWCNPSPMLPAPW